MRTFTLIAALLCAPVALADSAHRSAAESHKAAKLDATDLQVAAHYHELDQREIELGQTALRLSHHAGIRSYAEMLINDHAESDKKLVALVKARGQTIPVEKPLTEAAKIDKAEDKARVAKLKAMKGNEFDSAFIATMIDTHEKELSMADTLAAKVTDSELGDEVRAKKQTLQHHADEARGLRTSQPVASR